MHDTVVRDALLRNAADEPPMAFTSADLMRAGRRSRRLRHGATVAGSALVVAALAGFAFAVIPDRVSAPEYGRLPIGTPLWTTLDATSFCAIAATAVEPAVAQTSVINPKNGFAIAIPTEPAEHAAARFSCYLMHAVPQAIPGASFARDPNTPAGTVPLQAYVSRAFDPDRPLDTSPPFFSASAVVSDEGGVGEIGFAVGSASESEADAEANCTQTCSVRRGPHGELVTVLTVESDTGYRLVNVNVYRGQTVTFASASNGMPVLSAPGEVEAITNGQSPQVGRAHLPISVEDLISMLTAPQLTLFP